MNSYLAAILILFLGNNLCLPQSIDSVQNESWEKVFFPIINNRIKEDNIDTLKNKILSEGELEIRLWILPAFDPIYGYIIKRNDIKFSGTYVEPSSYLLSPLGDVINAFSKNIFNSEFVKVYGTKNLLPTSNWNLFWLKLDSLNIQSLPDENALNITPCCFDGVGFVVEVLNANNYRTYHYVNPMEYNIPECQTFWDICKLFIEEFP